MLSVKTLLDDLCSYSNNTLPECRLEAVDLVSFDFIVVIHRFYVIIKS